MAIFKCKMCGETLNLLNAVNGICRCELCNTTQTISRLSSEKIEGLFGRAVHLRRINDFDGAKADYEQILTEDPEDCEAYWGVVLCRYGIEYVKDPKTGCRVPIMHRTQITSILDDEDYKLALEYANDEQRDIYQREAEAINVIQNGILDVSSREEPFDVFICYKETDENGQRTEDSVIGYRLYRDLEQSGIKVFYARETLKNKLGTEYEPYIFSALHSSKVMIVIGTKPEYFKAVWVRNEWSRFLDIINSGTRRSFFPAFKGVDPYEMPKEFNLRQGQDLSEVGGYENLLSAVERVVGKKKQESTKEDATKQIQTLIKRGYDALSFGSFEEAVAFANQVIEQEYENADAYVILLLAELKIETLDDLNGYTKPIEKLINFRKALGYAQGDLKEKLKQISEVINSSILKYEEDKRISEQKLLQEEKRIAEQKRLAEERRKAETKQKEEEQRLAEQKRIAEEKRLAEEKRIAEQKRLEEEARLAEQKKKAELTRLDEERRLVEEKHKNELERLTEEKKKANEKQIAEAERIKGEKRAICLSKLDYASVGDTVTIGEYESEPIEWIILSKENGKALLISKNIINFMCYNNKQDDITWENSTVRKWLNDSFYQNAFNNYEKEKIQLAEVNTPDRKVGLLKLKTVLGGNSTQDRIFLLSIEEAEKYFQAPSSRLSKPTANVRNSAKVTFLGCDGNFAWYLRDPGNSQKNASIVDAKNGNITVSGIQVSVSNGIRPAIWVTVKDLTAEEKEQVAKKYNTEIERLDGEYNFSVKKVSEEDKYFIEQNQKIEEEYSAKIKQIKEAKYKFIGLKIEGDYIYFGSYPQEALTLTLNDSITLSPTERDNLYMGDDGEQYYGKDGKFYKVQPIKWKILSYNGNQALILCDSIIDAHRFEFYSQSNNYAKSEIRKWLNNEFYNTAFTDLQKKIIQTTTVDNSALSTGCSTNTCACANTNDKIFLLSYKEVTNTVYGFSENDGADSKRSKKPSDYALSNGGYKHSNGNGWWWLRSPSDHNINSARGVSYYGAVNDHCPVRNSSNGVVPALQICLQLDECLK